MSDSISFVGDSLAYLIYLAGGIGQLFFAYRLWMISKSSTAAFQLSTKKTSHWGTPVIIGTVREFDFKFSVDYILNILLVGCGILGIGHDCRVNVFPCKDVLYPFGSRRRWECVWIHGVHRGESSACILL